ncbi:MAG: S8 family serine peptidase [Planctomycetota bacterium]
MSTFILLSCMLLAQNPEPALQPRQPLQKFPLVAAGELALPETPRELVVKFQDGLRVRFDGRGGLQSVDSTALEPLMALASQEGLQFAPLLQCEPETISQLELRAQQRTGRMQPDLLGMHRVLLPESDLETLLRIGTALQALDCVEFAEVEHRLPEPPSDYPPVTPNYISNQTWQPSNPGFDFTAGWARGANGAGVKLSDCEYGWHHAHEDLVDQTIVPEPGQTIPSFVSANGWDNHGTAALGVSAASQNAYGCTGGAYAATFATFPENSNEQGARRATCIANAIAGSALGDVVLLEMQTTGAGGGYGPAEYNQSVWNVVKVGTDAGVVVVAAAGNGAQDLDSFAYVPYMSRGDSGAIIVGAGTSNTSHTALSFSTYGTRVDVQGWGQSVFTLGYGGYAMLGGDILQAYTNSFNGTSSGSATIAAVATAVQSYAKTVGPPLDSVEMRDLLIATGIPQGPGVEIGPLPDIDAALDGIGCGQATTFCPGMLNLNGTIGEFSYVGSFDVAANDLTFHVTGCTPNSFGIYIMGPGQTAVFSGNGMLCVDLAWRLAVTPIDVFGMSPFVFDNQLDPFNPYTISPGSTWNFQYWYRDGASWNFTGALQVQFCQ